MNNVSRRNFLCSSLQVTAAGALVPLIGSTTFGATAPALRSENFRGGKAKSVIQIWMWGGPSHLDTFDPKPAAGRNYCGDWDKPLTTNVPSIEISQSLPNLATCADLYSVVRSVTHGSNAHETASYMMQTGRTAGGATVYPSAGAVISKIKGYDAGYDDAIPPYVVLTTSLGRFSECGFLGPRYKPFVTGGDPSKSPFLVSGYVVEGITPERQEQRMNVLGEVDPMSRVENDTTEAIVMARQNAYRLMRGDAVKVFDLASEPEPLREAYGKTWFGQSCLMARRLVQRGVPFIAINYRGWDTHKRHFETLARRQKEWDQGLAMLLKELRDLNLLDSTIIWWGGEFGRTPKIGWESPWFGGRSHFGRCFNVMLAGGGFRGGSVVGESDATGENVASRPVAPQDILGSIYTMAGIDPNAPLPNEKGIETPTMTPASSEGLLNEIMA
ncbi:MAG: DUF1501 domain-containing protein [Thermoguttaceae bacterium]